jgi:hypothetical protein
LGQFTVQSGLGSICVNPFGAGDHLPIVPAIKIKAAGQNLVTTIARVYMYKNRSRIRITTMHKDTIDQFFICISQGGTYQDC